MGGSVTSGRAAGASSAAAAAGLEPPGCTPAPLPGLPEGETGWPGAAACAGAAVEPMGALDESALPSITVLCNPGEIRRRRVFFPWL